MQYKAGWLDYLVCAVIIGVWAWAVFASKCKCDPKDTKKNCCAEKEKEEIEKFMGVKDTRVR